MTNTESTATTERETLRAERERLHTEVGAEITTALGDYWRKSWPNLFLNWRHFGTTEAVAYGASEAQAERWLARYQAIARLDAEIRRIERAPEIAAKRAEHARTLARIGGRRAAA